MQPGVRPWLHYWRWQIAKEVQAHERELRKVDDSSTHCRRSVVFVPELFTELFIFCGTGYVSCFDSCECGGSVYGDKDG